MLGRNGMGKTTLIRTAIGFTCPKMGKIFFKDRDVTTLRPYDRVRMGMGLVPQGRRMFRSLSVRESLTIGVFKESGKWTLERIYDIFPRLKERLDQSSSSLSGGEQQMLAIARALMSRPSMLLLDEPSIGLAPLVVRQIFATVTGLRKEGRTIMLVEQNARAALAVADRGYVMETGQVVLEGTAAELAANRDVQRAYLGKEYRRIEER
jgi:branched-chain amino acid transport system ATP-binding protein